MKRWRRFGIKAMLVLVVLISVPMAWIAIERNRHARCSRLVEELRQTKDRIGFLQFTPDMPRSQNLLGHEYYGLLLLDASDATDEKLFLKTGQIQDLYGIEDVFVYSKTWNWEQLHELPDLKRLALNEDPKVFVSSPSNLSSLAKFRGLETFEMVNGWEKLDDDHIHVKTLRKVLPGTEIEVWVE